MMARARRLRLSLVASSVIMLGAWSCTPEEIAKVNAGILTAVETACADYVQLSPLVRLVSNPIVATLLIYGDSVCDPNTFKGVQPAALPIIDQSTPAWVGGINAQLKAAVTAPATIP